jgi:site-specific recombinase XerC
MFKDSVDLLIVRDLAMILLSFSGFLRYDEVSSLRFNDVKVHDNHLVSHL